MSIFNYLLDRSLEHVKRFNNRPNNHVESDATHSFYTAHFAHIICLMLAKHGVGVDVAKAVPMALIHDLEEGQTGDILNPFKHRRPEVTQAIKLVGEEMIVEQVEELPDYIGQAITDLWHEEMERETIEAQVVKVADTLSLISKCHEEIQTGNRFFQDIFNREVTELKRLNYPWWVKIRDEVLAGAENEI